jgi:hypothetical protein
MYHKCSSIVLLQKSFLPLYEWNEIQTDTKRSFTQKRWTQLCVFRLFNHPQGCPTILKYIKILQFILSYNSSFIRICN